MLFNLNYKFKQSKDNINNTVLNSHSSVINPESIRVITTSTRLLMSDRFMDIEKAIFPERSTARILDRTGMKTSFSNHQTTLYLDWKRQRDNLDTLHNPSNYIEFRLEI